MDIVSYSRSRAQIFLPTSVKYILYAINFQIEIKKSCPTQKNQDMSPPKVCLCPVFLPEFLSRKTLPKQGIWWRTAYNATERRKKVNYTTYTHYPFLSGVIFLFRQDFSSCKMSSLHRNSDIFCKMWCKKQSC